MLYNKNGFYFRAIELFSIIRDKELFPELKNHFQHACDQLGGKIGVYNRYLECMTCSDIILSDAGYNSFQKFVAAYDEVIGNHNLSGNLSNMLDNMEV